MSRIGGARPLYVGGNPGRNERMRPRIADAASCGSACSSQTRTTVQPAAASAASFRQSRAWLYAILWDQYSAFARGADCLHSQPCQKQPSTNTPTCSRGKTMSAVQRRPGTGRTCLRRRGPRRWSADRSTRSGVVSVERFALIRARAAGFDARGDVRGGTGAPGVAKVMRQILAATARGVRIPGDSIA